MSVDYVFGLHAVQAMLEKSPENVLGLLVLKGRVDGRLKKITALAERNGLEVQTCERSELDKKVNGQHQGVVAQLKGQGLEVYDERYLKSQLPKWQEDKPPFILILDGVTDPHNLGACLRSAEAAGVNCVIVPKDNAASLNATVIKVACGAAEVLPLIRVTNLARTMEWLQDSGIWIVGTAGEAETPLHDQDLKGPLAIVMGSEGKGMRRLIREHCDYLVKIPMAGTVSSLNVSVAAGVCLFEAVRQR